MLTNVWYVSAFLLLRGCILGYLPVPYDALLFLRLLHSRLRGSTVLRMSLRMNVQVLSAVINILSGNLWSAHVCYAAIEGVYSHVTLWSIITPVEVARTEVNVPASAGDNVECGMCAMRITSSVCVHSCRRILHVLTAVASVI